MSSDALEPIEQLPAFAGILREQQDFATTEADDFSSRVNGWFNRLMMQSGLELSPPTMLMLCLFAAVTSGLAAFVAQENPLSTALGGLIGAALPIAVVVIVRMRRQSRMMQQVPAMLDDLARAAKTGRSIEHCFQMVSAQTEEPLGSELQRGARRMQMGIEFEKALRELPERTGLVTLNILVTALSVHQQMGGDLVTVLQRLSETIRDRLLFLGRLKAATIASRATAVMMITLPLIIFTFFAIREPDYLSRLMASSWGRGSTALAVILQILGSFWVLRVLKTSQQG